MKFATNPLILNIYLTLAVLLHYLEKFKIQIFCNIQHSRNANKLHFNRLQLCYSSTNFDICGV